MCTPRKLRQALKRLKVCYRPAIDGLLFWWLQVPTSAYQNFSNLVYQTHKTTIPQNILKARPYTNNNNNNNNSYEK